MDILWTAVDNVCVDSVAIVFTADLGQSYELLAMGEPNDGSYAWEVPDISSTACLIRVYAYDPCLKIGYDTFDGAFSIDRAVPCR